MKNVYDIFRLLLLLTATVAAQLPYNPTRIFLSPQNDRLAYVLRPSSANQFSISSLDLSSNLTSSLLYATLSSTLPFLKTGTSQPLDAVVDSAGNITVYTGNCASNGQSQIWRLNTQEKETGVDLWAQQRLFQVKKSMSESLVGANYLASGIAFSTNVSSSPRDTRFYFFGGMCPTSEATGDTWTSSAEYSNSTLTYFPAPSGSAIAYNEGLVSTRNHPIAQAGHTMTGLHPTHSNRTDGSQTQQQNFVLLGGHTQEAFINMSQVALYSLPQEAWTYFPVSQPSSGAQVLPRSGHTATLSSDGTKMVLIGGWVGDVNTPASPQIAILNVAESYGGAGDWNWSVPSTAGIGGSMNTGIYGHGAMVLPGDVLLVVGGYTIPASTASKWRRATTFSQTANSNAYFYNFTSNVWLTDYTAPESSSPQGISSSGALSKTSQKAGLGVGLSLGTIAVAALFGLYFWYSRRQKSRREARDRDMKALTFASYQYGSDEWGMLPAGSRGSNIDVANSRRETKQSLAGRELAHGWRAAGSVEAERTGLLVEIPSPTRGLRRSASGRGPYPYEKRGSRNMEPIAERAALEEPPEWQVPHDTELQAQASALLGSPPTLDPFNDADPLRSHPVSIDGNSLVFNRTSHQRDEEVRGWMEEWEKAAQALIDPGPSQRQQRLIAGRESPSKSERTESILSEQSTHSSFSYRSGTGGAGGIVRSLSMRSAAILSSLTSSFTGGLSAARSPPVSPVPITSMSDARMSLPSQRRRPVSLSIAQTPRPATIHVNDELTARATTLSRLQDEGQSLLPSPTRHAPPLSMSLPKTRNRYKSPPTSPAKEENETEMNTNLNRGRKGAGWVGSVRRVISGAYAASSSHARTPSGTSNSATSSPVKERYKDEPEVDEWARTASPAPVDGVKRAVSDAAFWKSKKGQKDWLTGSDDEETDSESHSPLTTPSPGHQSPSKRPRSPRARSTTTSRTSRSATGAAAEDGNGEDEDWDVERAAESRLVQLMFTVPRQRLRVVNCDVDNQSMVSLVPERSKEDQEKEAG
ncbi:hypothetical protein E2P81_ATG01760 [Venturia nashicola]|nr:hypothetical protein E2P81_ATG01760 [Venturia nashicola]